MSQAPTPCSSGVELHIERTADRVHYLASADGFEHRLTLRDDTPYPDTQVDIIRWTAPTMSEASRTSVTLCISRRPFDMQTRVSPAEARRIAVALIAAADEADTVAAVQAPEQLAA